MRREKETQRNEIGSEWRLFGSLSPSVRSLTLRFGSRPDRKQSEEREREPGPTTGEETKEESREWAPHPFPILVTPFAYATLIPPSAPRCDE